MGGRMADETHERSTVSVRAVLIGAAAIAAGVFVSLLVAWGLLDASGKPPMPPTGQPFARVSGPPLAVTPRQDIERYRADEQRKLAGYRLVDEKAGVVHIPIERAMALLATEHGEVDTRGGAGTRDEAGTRDDPGTRDAAGTRGGGAQHDDAATPGSSR
jgi:hypothetical protein